jgi:hypothetical protein
MFHSNASYRQIWRTIDMQFETRAACKLMVGSLALAARIVGSRNSAPASAGKTWMRRRIT